MKKSISLVIVEEMAKTYPEIMKRFIKVFSPNKLENNPVIEIIKMKK